MEASVSEIHCYPLRPEGFAEPLFPTPESQRAIMEHLLEADWLSRASSLNRGGWCSVHTWAESAELARRADGGMELVRRCGRKRRRRAVTRILEWWRVVRGWWADSGEDRFLYQLLLSDGSVVDVAQDRVSREWLLVGVED